MRFRSSPIRFTMQTSGRLLFRPVPVCVIAFLAAALPAQTTADNGFSPLQSAVGPLSAIAQAVSADLKSATKNSVKNTQSEAQQRVFGHLLYRSRRQQLLLSRAARNLEAGKTADAFLYLQTLIDAPQDSFTWLGNESRLVSVRSESMRLLGSQPKQILQAYERIYRAEADSLLAKAHETGDPELFRELGRRYYFTSAGFQAMDWQASRWFDQGDMGQAARTWKRLASEPAHRHRMTRSMLLKTTIALKLAGHRADAFAQNLGDRGIPLGNGELATQAWLDRQTIGTTLSTRLANQAVWPGRNATSGREKTTTPFLTAAWSQPYSSGPDELLRDLVSAWEKRQRENLQPLAVANSAVVADDSIILRDFARIRAFDVTTGKPRWSYDCATSLKSVSRKSLSRVASSSGSSPSTSVDVRNAYAANSTMGVLSSDGERVYAVDYVDLTRQHRSQGRFTRSQNSATVKQPQLISREANRLIALAVNPDGQTKEIQRPLWSIGGAVGTPEWFVRMDRNVDGKITREEFAGAADRFSTIDTNNDSAIGLREAAASSGFSDHRNPLWGHFFLGAPLAANGRLYAVTEADRQLNLVALKPESGELLWSQAIGFVEIPIERDANRYPLQCTPSFADGILICPTQLGFLVGLDSSTGSLLWAYYYGDDQSLSRLGRWPHRPQRNYGHAGFPCVAHIASNRIVVLPRQSNLVHCLDLKTGKQIWTNPRQDAEYIGTVDNGRVMLVGSRHCRGLSLQSGADAWTTRMGMPSGRGIRAGNNYLLPLQAGRIATLDLSSGNEVGFTLAQSNQDSESNSNKDQVSTQPAVSEGITADWHPGNLVAVGDLVLSAGAHRLVAFPQAGAMLTSLERESQHGPMSPQSKVLTAELNLALGHMDLARSRLTEVLSTPMPQADLQRAETLLRELLYLQLRHQSDNSQLFAQLERLSKTPSRRGRFLMQRAEAQLTQADFAGVLQSTREFSSLNLDQPLPTVGDPSLRVTAASWVRSVVGRVQNRFGDDQLVEISAHVDREQQRALAANDTTQLEQFLAIYSQWPQAELPRSELARQYIAAGEFQKAELLLLTNRNSRDRVVAKQATTMLAGLWDRLGLWHEAAGLIKESDEQAALVNLPDGLSTRELLPEISRSGMTAYALKQRELPNWQVSRVDILERPWVENDPQLAATYGRYRRRFPTHGQSTFQLLVKGTRGTEELTVIDRQTGRIVSTVPITHRVSYPSTQHMSNVGHFIPLGGPAAANGISLLTGETDRQLWTTRPQGLSSQQETLRVGPAGPTFCSFQARRTLIVTDPGSGRILWQRTDLDPHGGLLNDPYAGLFGDDQALVLFAADRVSYTVYKTSTGEVLKSGRLDVEVNQQRRVFGRKLCYVARKENETRLRIWDPLLDRIEFDEQFEGRLYTAVTPDQELAAILPTGRLVIVNVATGEKRLDFTLDAADLANLNYMRVFSSNGRYFVNLQRAVRVPPSHTYNYYASDTFLDAMHVQGELLAVDQTLQRLQWRRTLPQRSIIRTPQFQLPFLMAMSGVRDRRNGNRQSLLIEVIDIETGETIGLKSNIRPDRIVQCTYQPEHGCIQLRGLKTLIELKFDKGRQRLSLDDGAL